MTRRSFLTTASIGFVPLASEPPLVIPLNIVLNKHAKFERGELDGFWSDIWPEAVRDFARCDIRFDASRKSAEIRRSPSGNPVFTGLHRGAINLVITDHIPFEWDNGRGVSGLTTLYQGYHLCIIALYRAHGHQVPLLSVNTCVHELLHVLLQDIFEHRPKGVIGAAREFRIDLYATRLWLLSDGAAIRASAGEYLARLRSSAAHNEKNYEQQESVHTSCCGAPGVLPAPRRQIPQRPHA
jgi:hypothetical protein